MTPQLRGSSQPPSESALGDEVRPPDWPLAQRVAKGGSAVQVADATALLWHDVELALQPVIGRRGVASLFERTLHLASNDFHWLPSPAPGDLGRAVETADLVQSLAMQSPEVAIDASNAMFTIFHQLICTLIGTRLCNRLLQSVWSAPSEVHSGPDAQP